ncbi:MAG: hypothetical protein JW801_04450 [Bacteroidales bacterium]|nr:hypothetical protein [Bacteroidales bacterium]
MKAYRLLLVGALFLLAAECEFTDNTGLSVAQRLEGKWHVEDTELKNADDWYDTDIYISELDSNSLVIENFHNLGGSMVANIAGMTLDVPNQEVANGYTIEGSATISFDYNQLVWTYRLDDGSGIWTNWSATYTKIEGY